MKRYVIIQDRRDGKLYVDKKDSFMRPFEEVIASFSSFREALEKYPSAISTIKKD